MNHGTNADLSASCGVSCEKAGVTRLRDDNGKLVSYQPGPNHPLKEIPLVLEHLKIVGQDGSEHRMQRLHFPIWKDFGAVSTMTLRALADKVESLNPDSDRPIHIHCRAGVGRTGTLISFIAAREQIKTAIQKGVACSPKMIVKTLLDVIAKGRIDRGPMFVQTGDQFKLLVDSLMEQFDAELLVDRATTPPHGNSVLEGNLRRQHAESGSAAPMSAAYPAPVRPDEATAADRTAAAINSLAEPPDFSRGQAPVPGLAERPRDGNRLQSPYNANYQESGVQNRQRKQVSDERTPRPPAPIPAMSEVVKLQAEENVQLKNENVALKCKNAELEAENASLKHELATLRQWMAQQRATL